MAKVDAYIGLGSNLGDSVQTLRAALQALERAEAIHEVTTSSFYRSKPVGPQDQPDYVNAVARVQTSLSALELLAFMFSIERQHGRVRREGARWGARTLDLDLLLYGEQVIDSPELRVPHPQLCRRSFVVVPLLELAPDQQLPGGRYVKACLSDIQVTDLQVIPA